MTKYAAFANGYITLIAKFLSNAMAEVYGGYGVEDKPFLKQCRERVGRTVRVQFRGGFC
jgi:hypothetical protein